MDDRIENVRRYYDSQPQQEYDRIGGRAEFRFTVRFMNRHIHPGDRVLDIGGGPGRYSHYLAARGAEVTLMDLSAAHVRMAMEKAREMGLKLHGVVGDARLADTLAAGEYDHVLLMGPLYHLLTEEERVQCVEAAMKKLKPGGTLWAAFINMTGDLIFRLRNDPASILSMRGPDAAFREKLCAGEEYAGEAFTDAYFSWPKHAVKFMDRFPLERLHVFPQEGLLAHCEDRILAAGEAVTEAWLDMSEAMCEREEYWNWGEHLMIVGRKKTC